MQFLNKGLVAMFFLINIFILANMGVALASSTTSVGLDCRTE